MRFHCNIWKEGAFWLIECPDFDALTQGRTKKEAMEMMVDWIRTALEDPSYEAEVITDKYGTFLRVDDPKPIIGLILLRKREELGFTMEQVARMIGVKSRSSVRQLESGRNDPGISTFHRIVGALGFDFEVRLVKRAP